MDTSLLPVFATVLVCKGVLNLRVSFGKANRYNHGRITIQILWLLSFQSMLESTWLERRAQKYMYKNRPAQGTPIYLR